MSQNITVEWSVQLVMRHGPDDERNWGELAATWMRKFMRAGTVATVDQFREGSGPIEVGRGSIKRVDQET